MNKTAEKGINRAINMCLCIIIFIVVIIIISSSSSSSSSSISSSIANVMNREVGFRMITGFIHLDYMPQQITVT
jgi:hypothetical protein